MSFPALVPICFRLLLGVLSLLAVGSAYGESNPQSADLTLRTAMAMAIRNNLELRVDALDSSISAADLERSRGIYDPYQSVSINGGRTNYAGETYGTKNATAALGLNQNLPTGGSISVGTQASYTRPVSGDSDEDWTDWYTSVGVTVTQPLLKNFGKEVTELDITLAGNYHEESLEQFRLSVIDTIYAVIKAYNRLYTLRQVLDSREQALSSAQQLLAKIKQQNGYGEQTEVASANVEYSISQRLKELVDAERDIKDQEARLRYLIGEESKISLIPVDPPSRDEPQETVETAMALALEHRPDLKQLRLDLKSSELQERVAKQKLLPNLDVNASGGLRGIEDRFSDSAAQIGDGKGGWWSAGLQFSVPLGNSVAKSAYRREQLRTRQKKNQLSAFEWKIRDYIEADMRLLISARVQRQVADKAVKLAEQRVERYRASLARNTSKVQDLLDAENDLVYARNSQTEAAEAFANAVALLWKDAGVLLERKAVRINAERPEELTAGTMTLPALVPGLAAALPERLKLPEKVASAAATPLPQPPVVQAVPVAIEKTPVAAAVPKSSPRSVSSKTQRAVAAAMYTLKIGEYVSSELDQTKRKIKTAGLVPRVSSGSKQPREVIRLWVGIYATQQAAQQELKKLAKLTDGGFIVKQGKGDYRLYAGSYFTRHSARKEQQRLAARGLKLSLEPTTVKLPTTLLTAGHFNSRDAALAGASKLARLGVKAVVIRES